MRISIVLLKYPAGSLLLIIAILSVSARTGRCDDDRAVPKCEAASMMCPTDQDDWRLADNGNVAYYVLPEANRFCIYFKCGPNNFNGLIRQSIDGERLVIVNFTTTYSNKAIESLVVDASRSFSLRHSPGDVYCPPVFALRSHNDTASELNVCNVIQYAQRVLSASENITVEANEAFTVNASCSYSRGGPAVGPSALDVRFPSRTLYQSWLQRGNSCMLSSDERANICPVRMDLTKAGFGGAYARLQFRCNDCEDVPKHIDPLQKILVTVNMSATDTSTRSAFKDAFFNRRKGPCTSVTPTNHSVTRDYYCPTLERCGTCKSYGMIKLVPGHDRLVIESRCTTVNGTELVERQIYATVGQTAIADAGYCKAVFKVKPAPPPVYRMLYMGISAAPSSPRPCPYPSTSPTRQRPTNDYPPSNSTATSQNASSITTLGANSGSASLTHWQLALVLSGVLAVSPILHGLV